MIVFDTSCKFPEGIGLVENRFTTETMFTGVRGECRAFATECESSSAHRYLNTIETIVCHFLQKYLPTRGHHNTWGLSSVYSNHV
jgi:hypothetical protein